LPAVCDAQGLRFGIECRGSLSFLACIGLAPGQKPSLLVFFFCKLTPLSLALASIDAYLPVCLNCLYQSLLGCHLSLHFCLYLPCFLSFCFGLMRFQCYGLSAFGSIAFSLVACQSKPRFSRRYPAMFIQAAGHDVTLFCRQFFAFVFVDCILNLLFVALVQSSLQISLQDNA